MDETYLEHYGVKGMHWGVRNSDTLRKYASSKTRSRISETIENSKAKKITKKDRKKAARNRSLLSDDELKYRIDRYKQEKELKKLTNETLKPGRTAVKNVLSSSAKQVGKGVAVGVGTYATTVILSGGKFDPIEASKWIANPAKKKK